MRRWDTRLVPVAQDIRWVDIILVTGSLPLPSPTPTATIYHLVQRLLITLKTVRRMRKATVRNLRKAVRLHSL